MNARSTSKREKIKVGDRVWIPWARTRRLATVVEDRGHIGVNGRRLLRITLGDEEDGRLSTFEIPEADVKPYRRTKNGHVKAR